MQENLPSPGEGRGGSRQREPREPISYPTASQLLNYDAPHLQQLVQQLMDEISHVRQPSPLILPAEKFESHPFQGIEY